MNCRNKTIKVLGFRYDGNEKMQFEKVQFECIVTNDKRGKTLSINDGKVQYTIPFEPLQKYLR